LESINVWDQEQITHIGCRTQSNWGNLKQLDLYMDITYINGDEWLLYHQNILSVPDLDRDKEDIQTD
jgi:hypothetical protein